MANTFYWDKKYTQDHSQYDYTLARIIHWAKNESNVVVGITASEKQPLENRVWYAYAGQSDTNHTGPSANPIEVARVIDDGATQAWRYEYNDLGNITRITDPNMPARVTRREYAANNIDLIGVYQHTANGEDKIAEYGNYSLHNPGFMKDAARQPTNYGYNSHGQLITAQNARGETTTYAYSDGTIQNVPNGYLASITSPLFPPINGTSAVTSFTYDEANRVRTVTNQPDLYTVTIDYDALDRPTQISYPDRTTQEFEYTQDFGQGPQTILDLTRSKDRQVRWTTRQYDENRHLHSVTEPFGTNSTRTTLFDWCNCGALADITDPNGNVTHFERDLQSRVMSKTFASGTPQAQTVFYTYEDTISRLKSMNDAMNQTTNYSYYVDDNLSAITYTNAVIPTPNVSYIFDPYYDRISSMTDGIGTTAYTYHQVTTAGTLGANQLQTETIPFSNDTITYTYDELGRRVSQSINGVVFSTIYDSLGRIGTSDNPLGHFSRAYESNVTPRLQTFSYPNGETANYGYFGNDRDRRLQTVRNLTSGSTNLSRFDYTYDSEGEIQSLSKLLGTTQTNLDLGYDDAQQLTSVTQGILHFDYGYDIAGNRLSDLFSSQFSHGGNTFTANNLNQLATVTRDPGVGGPAQGPFTIMYDGNGNMTYDGDHQEFEWDAANRLIAIHYTDTDDRTEFTYDGLGRRVKITEYGPAMTAVVRPKGGTYATFNTGSLNLPTGAYQIIFKGLNPNGGTNTAFVDQVALNGSLVANGGFETPQVNDYANAPAQSSWSYTGNAGIAANGGAFMGSNPAAPQGNQVAFVTNDGSLSQTGNVAAGTYTLSFKAGQRASGNQTYQQLRVAVRGASSTKTFVWSGSTLAEERNATGSTVTKRFFAEGEERVGGSDAGNYYYTRDHLGSIREVTDSTGALKAQYDYDAWGKQVVVSGSMNVDFGFTGHYFHQPSGLNLAVYRAYSPTMGRWISRDPIGEGTGINLYGYVHNRPLRYIDELGLADIYYRPETGYNPQGTIQAGTLYDFGHIVIVGRNERLDFIPAPNGIGTIIPGLFRSDNDLSDYFHYHVERTAEQDRAIDEAIRSIKQSKPPWTFLTSCSTLSSLALGAGSIDVNGLTPTSLWTSLPGNGPTVILQGPPIHIDQNFILQLSP